MQNICENCGKEFYPTQPHFKLCPDCFSQSKYKKASRLNELLLKAYYDKDNNLLKEIFIGVPEELAKIFSREGMATKQVRDFYQKILKARNKAFLSGINAVKPILYECQRDAAYQLKRNVIPKSFNDFLVHHLQIAEKNEKMLEGFCQHFESVLAYFPKEKKEY